MLLIAFFLGVSIFRPLCCQLLWHPSFGWLRKMGEAYVGAPTNCSRRFGQKGWAYSEVSIVFASQLSKSDWCKSMALFPRWSDLKHFCNVSTTTFGDGQAFYDILKANFHVHHWNKRNSFYFRSVFSPVLCNFCRKTQFLSNVFGHISATAWWSVWIVCPRDAFSVFQK